MRCDLEHPATIICEDPYCHVMQTDLMQRTILSVYKDLRAGLYTGCPMLLAQGLESLLGRADRMATPSGAKVRRHAYGVTEAHVVMNLPPELAYRVNESGEGLVVEYSSDFEGLSRDQRLLIYKLVEAARHTDLKCYDEETRRRIQRLWEKLA